MYWQSVIMMIQHFFQVRSDFYIYVVIASLPWVCKINYVNQDLDSTYPLQSILKDIVSLPLHLITQLFYLAFQHVITVYIKRIQNLVCTKFI